MCDDKNENPLPKTLPGAVCAQMVRCGKATCKCVRGELHGPYFYRFVWEHGKQRKVYIKQDAVKDVREACETHRLAAREQRAQRKANISSIRALLDDLAELEKLIAQLRSE